MKKVLLIITVLFGTFSSQICAQNLPLPRSTSYDPEVMELIEQAKYAMQQENYELANKYFRKALATKKVLPTSMSYFFAKTLYVIHQNQNARNFIEKYIELAGKGGDYYDEALNLKKLIDEQFSAIKNCEYCNLSGYRYIICNNCQGLGHTVDICYNCKGHGHLLCPKCIGKGVSISTNKFGEKVYSSCDICESKGYVTCPLCNGEKELAGKCKICIGTGKEVTISICNHQEKQ